MHMKLEMKKGKSFKAAARSWKKGSSRSKAKRKTSSTKRRRKTSSNKGGRRVGRRGFNSNTVKKLARLGAMVLPAAGILMQTGVSQEGKMDQLAQAYTGYSTRERNFKLERLLQGWGPSIGVEIGIQLKQAVGKFLKF